MKFNRIYYAPEAVNDLDEIRDYITEELDNPNAAVNTINSIINKIDGLKDFSETGAPLSSVIGITMN